MSFWDNNKDTFKKAGVATAKGIGKGTKAVSKAGYSTYKKSEAKRNGTAYDDNGTTDQEAQPYTGPPIAKVDKDQLKLLPAPPKRNVGAFEVPKSGEPSMYRVQPTAPVQYAQPGQIGLQQPVQQQPGQPIQQQPGQPGQFGQQPAQPGQYGQQPAQPGQYGQQPAQPIQPGQYGQPIQPQFAAQPGQYPSQPADVPPQYSEPSQFQLPQIQPAQVGTPSPIPARPIPPPPPRSSGISPNPTQPQVPLSFESPYHPQSLEAPQVSQQPTPQTREPAPINVNIAPMIPGMKNAANQLFQSYLQSQPLTPGASTAQTTPPQQQPQQPQQPHNINIAPFLPALTQAGGSFLKAQAQQPQQTQQTQQTPQPGATQQQNQGNIDISPYMPGVKLAAGSLFQSYQGQNAPPPQQAQVQQPQVQQAQFQQPQVQQPQVQQHYEQPQFQQPQVPQPQAPQPLQLPAQQQYQQPPVQQFQQPPQQQVYQPTSQQPENLPQYTPVPVVTDSLPVEEEQKPVKKSKFLGDVSHFAPPPTRREHQLALESKAGSPPAVSTTSTGKKNYQGTHSVASPAPPPPARPSTLPPVNSFAPPPKIYRAEHEQVQHKPSKKSTFSSPQMPTRPSDPISNEQPSPPPIQSPQYPVNSFIPPPKIHRGAPGHAEEPTPLMPTRPLNNTILNNSILNNSIETIKKAPPPKPLKKSSTIGDETKREIPPPPYTEKVHKKDIEKAEPSNGPINFAQQIALQRQNSSLPSVATNLKPNKPQKPIKLEASIPPVIVKKPSIPEPQAEKEHDFMNDLRISLKKVHVDRDENSKLLSETSNAPPKPSKPVMKPGPKPIIKPKPILQTFSNSQESITSTPIISPKPAISAKPDIRPKPTGAKPIIHAKPALIAKPPVPPARRTTPDIASIPSPKPLPASALRSASVTPPPPPPPRNYNRPAEAAPPKREEGPPTLNLEISTGWLDPNLGSSQMPKDLQGLTYISSSQSSMSGGTTTHVHKLNLRLKDLSILRYVISWTNSDFANAKVEILEYIPSPIVHNVPSKSDLVGYSGRFGDYIASWCDHKMGQQVGRGECWDLAQEALLKGCGKHAMVSTYTHHGFPILRIAGSNSGISFIDGVGQFDEIRRGDILQFKSCIFVDKQAGSTKTVGAPDHTAVVLDNLGDKIIVAEQNVNNTRFVVKGEYCLKDLTTGETYVYRPVPTDWPGQL